MRSQYSFYLTLCRESAIPNDMQTRTSNYTDTHPCVMLSYTNECGIILKVLFSQYQNVGCNIQIESELACKPLLIPTTLFPISKFSCPALACTAVSGLRNKDHCLTCIETILMNLILVCLVVHSSSCAQEQLCL